MVRKFSVIAVEVYDKRKFQRTKMQLGYLGELKVAVGNILNMGELEAVVGNVLDMERGVDSIV
jgi:hypothetical protein